MDARLEARKLSLSAVFFTLIFSLFQSAADARNDFEWVVEKTEWSASDEKNFSRFVTAIGTAVEKRSCGNVNRCMRSSANPYRSSDPDRLSFFADCADWPYFMRAYYAWKNKLPFGMVKFVKANPGDSNEGRDIRYTPLGNRVAERLSFVPTFDGPYRISSVLGTYIPNFISSATFRTSYEPNSRTPNLFSDFYPPRIDRSAVVPGTVLYDANGHVALVYKITDDGQVWYVDAHPDNSLTVGRFSAKVARTSPAVGAGFKKWRPLVLVGADQGWDDEYEGGELVGVPNSRIKDFSTEQFFGNVPNSTGNWRNAKFVVDGKPRTFHEFVRMRMSRNRNKQNPLNEFSSSIRDICTSLKDRVASVQAAVTNGIISKPYPDRMVVNIYGSSGEWESYSTPGRDVTLKMLFLLLKSSSSDFVTKWRENDDEIDYSGNNLPQDLLEVYEQQSQSCQFSYTNSDGETIPLNLETARSRLFLMSFSPYDCLERRWGATGSELSSCRDGSVKTEWYENLQQLRNHTERNVDARMDFTREQYRRLIPGVGVENPPDLDIRKHLRSL